MQPYQFDWRRLSFCVQSRSFFSFTDSYGSLVLSLYFFLECLGKKTQLEFLTDIIQSMDGSPPSILEVFLGIYTSTFFSTRSAPCVAKRIKGIPFLLLCDEANFHHCLSRHLASQFSSWSVDQLFSSSCRLSLLSMSRWDRRGAL